MIAPPRRRRLLWILTTSLAVSVGALALLDYYWSNLFRLLDEPFYDPYAFQVSRLGGVSITNPTSLQFGLDGRLYVTTRFGLIHRLTVSEQGGSFAVTDEEVLEAVQQIPNHNDQGQPLPELRDRLVTGLVVAGDRDAPVLFVSSSDPRIDKQDTDTNSGIVSRLDRTRDGWRRIDLVRGLPRSRYDHAPNGLALDRANNILYHSVGANTNLGAPSSKLRVLPDYALSGSILAIHLDRLGDTPYDLPTLDDPERPGSPDEGDPFGGNGGLNQAFLHPGGPITLYTTGLRNAYDLVLTPAGLFTIDNGPNDDFGGLPHDPELPESALEPSEGGERQLDALHRIAEPGRYLGHPNLTRAFLLGIPAAPGEGLAPDPAQARYLIPGQEDGALATFTESTNGLAMHWTQKGAWRNTLLAISLDRNLYLLQLDASGRKVDSKQSIAANLGGLPLDVWAQDPDSVFPNSIWVIDHSRDTIHILTPAGATAVDSVGHFFQARAMTARRFLRRGMIELQSAYIRWRQRNRRGEALSTH